MRFHRIVFSFFSLMTFFFIVSCGDQKKSNSQNVSNPICSELDCVSNYNWKIFIQGRLFPSKTRLDINGTTVLNECVAKQKYSVSRNVEPEMILLDHFYLPKKGDLRVELFDMGEDCESMVSILNNENVEFEIKKEYELNEVLIYL